MPFLFCCSICLVCGCTALICVCVDCESSNSNTNSKNSAENQTTSTPATNDGDESRETNDRAESKATNDNEATDTTTTATTADKPTTDPLSKLDLKNLPKPAVTMLNVLGWVVWVFLPLIGTFLITIWIYKTDAIRTTYDKLYSSALTLFVCALLNFMVFLQKFIDSVCKFVCGKICGTKIEKEKQRKKSVASEV